MFNKLHDAYPSLYGKSYSESDMDARYSRLVEEHKRLFGKSEPMIFSAAGRSEIAGNHTDHNLGKVIGATINLDTIAAVSRRDDDKVIVASEGFPSIEISLLDLDKKKEEENDAISIIRGISHAFKERGIKIGGWEANTSTRVLKGSGLSSSAAFEVLIAGIFNNLFNDDKLDPVEIAKIGQYAENVYFGKPSGLLDQISSASGGITVFDFKDKDKPIVKPLSVDFSDYGYLMVITDTRGNHADLTGEYSAIPEEMRSVASFYGKKSLREVDSKAFFKDIASIRESIKNDRAILRAYHFFKENERVDAIEKALREKDFNSFLSLVKESGNSSFRFLQNVFTVIDYKNQGLSVAIAISESILNGEGAVRVHGGGFAGTIQAYVPKAKVDEYIKGMESIFSKGCSSIIEIRKLPVARIY